MRLCCRKAQSIAEYTVVLAIIASALLGMQVYVKRGLQGRIRDASDFVASTLKENSNVNRANKNSLTQYEPYYRASEKNITQFKRDRKQMFIGGGTRADNLIDFTRVQSLDEIDQTILFPGKQ